MTDYNFVESVEQSLIGLVLVSTNFWQEVFEGVELQPFHFQNEFHQRIWIELKKACDKNESLDMNILAARLKTDLKSIFLIASKSSLVNSSKEAAKIVLKNYTRRQASKIYQDALFALSNDDCEPQTIISDSIKSLDNIDKTQNGKIQSVLEIFAERDSLQQSANYEKQEKYGQFGISSLDNLLGERSKFKAGDLISIIAPSGHGKTGTGLHCAAHLQNKLGKSGLIFSLEMDKFTVMDKLFACISKIPLDDIEELSKKNPNPSRSQQQKQQEYNDFLTKIVDIDLHITENITDFDEIVLAIKNHKRKHKLDFVVIDYIGLVGSPKGYKSENGSYDRVGNMTKALKILARKENIAIIQLCQTNKDGAVAESQKIIHDSDMAIMVERNIETGKTTFTVKKDRKRGNLGQVQVGFDKSLQTFCNN